MKKYNYSYDRLKALSVLRQISSTEEVVIDDVIRTRSFINSIFDEYENDLEIEKVEFAFIIPTRASRFDENYWEEVYDFLPALKHLSLKSAFIALSSLPPFRIEMYGDKGESSSGALIFAPVFSDMLKDYRNKLLLSRRVRKRINETVLFAHQRFGVKYVGLGAILPKLTKYGKTIKVDVVTTTGHAGTTWLVQETVKETIKNNPHLPKDITIGFIGGGAIGSASMRVLAKELPDAKFITFDKRPEINIKNQKNMQKIDRILKIAESNNQLIEESHLIVSAITSMVDVSQVDLSGKIIIDDSQPGSFDRKQVESQGGELIWVIGEDDSKNKFITRRQGYSYGPHGLNSSSDIWGCEAEVAAIAYAGVPEFAVKDAVSIKDVDNFDRLFKELGVKVAQSQSFGQLNGKK